MLILLFLVVEHTVAVSLVVGVIDLVLELLAHTLGLLCPLQTAGAVAARALQPLTDGVDNFLVLIQRDLHDIRPFLFDGSIIPCNSLFFLTNLFF